MKITRTFGYFLAVARVEVQLASLRYHHWVQFQTKLLKLLIQREVRQ